MIKLRGVLTQHAIISSVLQSLEDELLSHELNSVINNDYQMNVSKYISENSGIIILSVLGLIGIQYYNNGSMKKLLDIEEYNMIKKKINTVIAVFAFIFLHNIDNAL